MKLNAEKTALLNFSNKDPFLRFLGISLATAPLFKGLYYEEYVFLFTIAITGTFLIFFWQKYKSFNLFKIRLDYAILLFLLAYIMSVFFAADSREAISVSIRIFTAVLVYFIVGIIPHRDSEIKGIIGSIWLGALFSSILTLLVMFNLVEMNNVFDPASTIVSTTLQYKNAGALLLLIGILTGMFLWTENPGGPMKAMLVSANYLMVILLVGTQSRTVWILSLPMLIIYFMLQKSEVRKLLTPYLITSLPAFLIHNIFYSSLSENELLKPLFILTAGTVLALSLMRSENILIKAGFPKKNKQVSLAIGALVFALAAAFILSADSAFAKRLTAISFSEFAFQERLVFYQDAWKIIKDNPVFGAGGGGWDALYLNLQSYGYYAEHVHNDYLQVLLEAGPLGLLGLISILLMNLKISFQLSKRPELSKIGTLVFSITVVMALHSLIDFDMAHTSLTLILFSLLGASRFLYQQNSFIDKPLPDQDTSPGLWVKLPVSLLCGAVILISFTLWLGSYNYYKGTEALSRGWLDETRAYFLKSKKVDPFKVNTLVSLAQIELAMLDKNPSLIFEAESNVTRAIELRPAEPLFYQVYAQTLFRQGRIEAALDNIEKYVNRHPMKQQTYEILALTYLNAGSLMYQRGELEKGKDYFYIVLDTPRRIEKQLQQVSEKHMELWKINSSEPVLYQSPNLNLTLGKASAYLRQWDQAASFLTKVLEVENNFEAKIWLALVYNRLGDQVQSKSLLEDASLHFPQAVESYEKLHNLLPN